MQNRVKQHNQTYGNLEYFMSLRALITIMLSSMSILFLTGCGPVDGLKKIAGSEPYYALTESEATQLNLTPQDIKMITTSEMTLAQDGEPTTAEEQKIIDEAKLSTLDCLNKDIPVAVKLYYTPDGILDKEYPSYKTFEGLEYESADQAESISTTVYPSADRVDVLEAMSSQEYENCEKQSILNMFNQMFKADGGKVKNISSQIIKSVNYPDALATFLIVDVEATNGNSVTMMILIVSYVNEYVIYDISYTSYGLSDPTFNATTDVPVEDILEIADVLASIAKNKIDQIKWNK